MNVNQDIIFWINDNPVFDDAKSRLQSHASAGMRVEIIESKYFTRDKNPDEVTEIVKDKIKAARTADPSLSSEAFILSDSRIFGNDDGGFQLLKKLGVGKAVPFNRGVVCSLSIVPPAQSNAWAEFDGHVIPISGKSEMPSDRVCAQIIRFFRTGQPLGLSLLDELLSRTHTALRFLRSSFRENPSVEALDGWRYGVGSGNGLGAIELFGAQQDFADYYEENLPELLGVTMVNRPARLKKWPQHWHNWRYSFCPFQSLHAAANEPWPDEHLLAAIWKRDPDPAPMLESGTPIKGGAVRTLVEIDALRADGGGLCSSTIAKAITGLDTVQRDWMRLQYKRLQTKLQTIDPTKIWFAIEQGHRECSHAREMVTWLRSNGVKE